MLGIVGTLAGIVITQRLAANSQREGIAAEQDRAAQAIEAEQRRSDQAREFQHLIASSARKDHLSDERKKVLIEYLSTLNEVSFRLRNATGTDLQVRRRQIRDASVQMLKLNATIDVLWPRPIAAKAGELRQRLQEMVDDPASVSEDYATLIEMAQLELGTEY